MQVPPIIKYAWHGSGPRWGALPLQLIGSFVGGVLFLAFGIKLPQEILDNPALSNLVTVAIGAAAGVLAVFCLRVCWWPYHWRLKPHGGLESFLRAKLGAFMWPVLLTTAGVVAFVLLSGIGLILLSLQVLNGSQIKSSVTALNTVGNPDFSLFVPQDRYRFTWPASSSFGMAFYLRRDSERNPSISNNPTFILRNQTNTVAYRVSATWKSETSMDLDEVVKSSPKLSKAQFIIKDTSLSIISKPGMPYANFQYYLDEAPTQVIPVIAKEEEVYFPIQLWPLVAIYLVDKIPDKIGETSPPFIAVVTLDWETSTGKQRRAYRVRITATNAKAATSDMPIVDAFLNFSLEEIKP